MGDFTDLCGRRRTFVVVMMVSLLLLNLLLLGCALNLEGKALMRFKERVKDPFGALSSWEDSSFETHHCSWFGVDCVNGHVVSLTLKNLCLEGTLAPELGHLVHIKLIILRNNSLSGAIVEEIGALEELEVLDLGYNNFSGPLPHELGNNIAILLLDNNGVFCQVSPELEQLMMISEVQVDESHLSPVDEGSQRSVKLKASCLVTEHSKALQTAMMRHGIHEENQVHHRDLRENLRAHDFVNPKTAEPSSPSPAPSSSPSPAPSPSPSSSPPPTPSSATKSSDSSSTKHKGSNSTRIIISASIVGSVVLCLIVGLFLMWRNKKIATVGPWKTGLSGQLQRSFVSGDDKTQKLSSALSDTLPTGGQNSAFHPSQQFNSLDSKHRLPKLKRLELETACEDFSNVVGSTTTGTLYKGTLSSGAEIAVLSHPVKTSKDWSKNMESQFSDKISSLSKLNHKNFLNLLGYCEEDHPFTKMLVFEYAPSGTLFEHLHVRESEHLDWAMRLRVAMGIAYCLDHMHKLTPRVIHENLTTYAVNLTEDYAAKISDFGIWNEVCFTGREEPIIINSANSPETSPEDNVYSFALILLEMMTGKAPFSWSTGFLNEWASDYLRSVRPLQDFVDPMLRHFDVDQLERIGHVIKSCTRLNPEERPAMVEVASLLRETTGIAPEAAAPRLSPMWWAELELMSPRPENQAPSS